MMMRRMLPSGSRFGLGFRGIPRRGGGPHDKGYRILGCILGPLFRETTICKDVRIPLRKENGVVMNLNI